MEWLDLTDVAVVMELPSPVKDHVQRFRDLFDPVLANNIPAEITIAGSSGVGSIAPGQDGRKILKALAAVAQKWEPFSAELGPVRQFPNSTVYAFSVIREEPFYQFHHALLKTGIRFSPSEYPFFPHCSLHIWGELSQELQQRIMECSVKGAFLIDSFALYQLVQGNAAVLVERFKFNSAVSVEKF